ncbi:uncharacterized protein PgNI_11946 [Pyricularia grisea]|uniref:Cyanovirin-N domain-containing protein n=1 Tax=Pyricularia grisea TaxID=148305 RepID=A0A6P8AR38_PYRGI|nr:uncharacterized protein PgNI_11946 [Pyricularia grisea]TLD04530.1 hypothetical protein PgNI_11946 [Pyricularia grisea]
MHISKAFALALAGRTIAADSSVGNFSFSCGNIVLKNNFTLQADCTKSGGAGGPTNTIDMNQCFAVQDDGTVECGKTGQNIRVLFRWIWIRHSHEGSRLQRQNRQ